MLRLSELTRHPRRCASDPQGRVHRPPWPGTSPRAPEPRRKPKSLNSQQTRNGQGG